MESAGTRESCLLAIRVLVDAHGQQFFRDGSSCRELVAVQLMSPVMLFNLGLGIGLESHTFKDLAARELIQAEQDAGSVEIHKSMAEGFSGFGDFDFHDVFSFHLTDSMAASTSSLSAGE